MQNDFYTSKKLKFNNKILINHMIAIAKLRQPILRLFFYAVI